MRMRRFFCRSVPFLFKRLLSASGVGLLFVASLSLGAVALYKHQASDKRLLEDATWAAFQLDRQTREMRIALLEASPTPADVDAVKLAYDILYSRLGIMEHGQIADLLRKVELRRHDLTAAIEQIRSLDAPIVALTPDTLSTQREMLRMELADIQQATGSIATQINHFFSQQRQTDREALFGLIRATLMMVLITMLTGGLLWCQLRRQQRALEERQASLGQANHQLLVARQEAEKASKAKSEFMAVISHEVRTPLNGIVGLTDLLEEEVVKSAQGREYLSSLKVSTDALATVINDILDYSRIAAGKLDIVYESVSLDAFLNHFCSSYRHRSTRSPVDFHCHVSSGLGHVRVDPNRLRQVLMNLLNNAFKFTDEGSVTLEVAAIDKGSCYQVGFSISDTGCGMNSAQQSLLFQPFSQVDTSLSRRREGTGLGLVISQQLVQAMGGRIRLESEAGKGSRFYFTLVLQKAQPAVDVIEPDSPGLALFANILVVEDNPINQMLVRKQLTTLGYQVSVAENGLEALKAVASTSFDLVLMDMQMPEMDGIEATRQLRSNGETFPILAMTANAMPEDKQRCLDAGMQMVITKPVKVAVLQRAITDYLLPVSSPESST